MIFVAPVHPETQDGKTMESTMILMNQPDFLRHLEVIFSLAPDLFYLC